MAKQKIKIPEITKCARCGADAKCIDWDFNEVYQVMCDQNHVSTGKFITVNRAIHRWNNEQKKLILKKELDLA